MMPTLTGETQARLDVRCILGAFKGRAAGEDAGRRRPCGGADASPLS
jgi:hypothetical protein